ncbi:glycoside hydrolase family 31 protein [Bacteroides sp. 51]|uniref:glycoside hydrolase family 31 protein n=1 Tax=Bacteroides sp. 51 TaxID=2302938 RepID=UPI0013D659A0|nr:glycoside hydrolase family 31 protein [Bacteroides sp. 51]NDV84116.1 glycoside hydrolase [Bacteroides sp. 51]
MKKILFFILILLSVNLKAQYTSNIEVLANEKWWGGATKWGSNMPYTISPVIDLRYDNFDNQTSPFLVSNKGRYIWSDSPFSYQFKDNNIYITSPEEQVKVNVAGSTLKEAYLAASKAFFPPSGELPPGIFFSKPQYNTWIELMYDQSQAGVLEYARNIIKNGLPPGVLMIDDNWQNYYGNFDFKKVTFPDPKNLIDELHTMGFKVMLWISPFVSPDSREFRSLKSKGYLIKRKGSDEPAMIQWWNGHSACYDLSNPKAYGYLLSTLKKLCEEYKVDGFKLDAGDAKMYREEEIDVYDGKSYGAYQSELWAKLGSEFPYNEYRACWKMGGQALVQRLHDKSYSWEDMQLLIPDMLAAGLLGHAYACPDMIGGGEYSSFLNIDSNSFDQQLIVRSCQIHAMMPMMQFSVAPWRILDKKHLDICVKFAKHHEMLGEYILSYAKKASETGEPIVRYMEYSFPDEGFEDCKDQFMLGDKYLVAPVLTSENSRSVKLPKGQWRDDEGKKYKGGKRYTFNNVPLERLPWFEKIK